MGYYEDLKVWQKARDLAVRAHRVTKTRGFESDPEIRDSIRRVAVDVACQIADGSVRGSEKGALAAYFNARGAIARLETLVEIAQALGNIDESPRDAIRQDSETIGKMLSGLIKAHLNPEKKSKSSPETP